MEIHWPTTTESIELGPSDVHVWAVALDESSAVKDTLSEDERERASRLRTEALRRRFVAARTGLRAILSRYLDVAPKEITFAYDAFGKPRLGDRGFQNSNSGLVHNTPQSAVHFNLTHSHDLALAAVAVGCAVGVDVERLRPVKHLEQLAQRYFHSAEADEVLSQNASCRDAAFFRGWTRKEAVLKAVGTGVQFPLETFCVPLSSTAAEWVEIPAWRSVSETRVWLTSIEPAAGYVAAVASQAARPNVRGFELSAS